MWIDKGKDWEERGGGVRLVYSSPSLAGSLFSLLLS